MTLSARGVRFKPRADAEQTRALVNCKDFGRSHIADNWLVTRHFCFQYVQKCAHADSGKSLSGARRGKEECTPSGYVDSVPSRIISPLTVGRRCICRLQDEHCAAPAFSELEWDTFACFPHVMCTDGLAFLKTAAIRWNLKEPANENACVSASWANEALENLKARQRYSIEEIRAELPPSHTWEKNARSAVEAAEFTCRISQTRLMRIYRESQSSHIHLSKFLVLQKC